MTQEKNNKLKHIKMKKISILIALLLTFTVGKSQERLKVDGVAVVVGKNIVLDSDIDKFKKELKQRMEGKLDITDCEILEEIMLQKLIAHHAVVDSVLVSEAEYSLFFSTIRFYG